MQSYFRKKAAHCRRLAANIVGDPTAEALLRLAEEFEAKAAAYDARKPAVAKGVSKRASGKSRKPRRKMK